MSEIKLPEIGEGTVEGEIIKWLVAEGDIVDEDTPLVEVMTDKATVEIPSPFPGTVLELRAKEGDVVGVGSVILVIGEEDDGEGGEGHRQTRDAGGAEVAPEVDDDTGAVVVETDEVAADEVADDAVAAARAMARAELDSEDDEVAAWEVPPLAASAAPSMPATRRLARQLGIDLREVEGAGKGGRVTKADLLDHVHQTTAARADESPATLDATNEGVPDVVSLDEAAPAAAGEAPQAVAAAAGPREERIPLRGLRRRIAERLSEAKRLIPHFTYVEECDMTEIVALRAEANERAAGQGLRITYLPFFIKALIEACRRHPIVNSSLDEERGEIVVKRYYNVGIATDTERGLMVPVVKNADRLNIFELAREIERLSADARAGRSAADDLQGGTITITSTGSIGGLLATPIINHPEVAILGVPAIRKRPVVRGDQIVIRDMVNLSLSLDHRIVDGAPAAQFTRDLVKLLEDPKLQLLAP